VSSSERWQSHFANMLRGLDFEPTRLDADVWIRLDKDKKGYECICTHVDDFMIVAKLPAEVMKDLQDIYTINKESIVEPDYYLGTTTRKTRREVGGLDAGNT
jgi:hypothetical protein